MNDSFKTVIQPITPAKVAQDNPHVIPREVIAIVNGRISANWKDSFSTAKVEQSEIIQGILLSELNRDNDLTNQSIFDSKWLNFEELYEAQGWTVTYHKPARGENFNAYFKFVPNKPVTTKTVVGN